MRACLLALAAAALACLLAAISVAAAASASSASSVLPPPPHPHSPIAHQHWRMRSSIPSADATATLSFVLAKRNLPELEATLLRVSDPAHADYGRHLSREQLRAMVAPDAAVVAQWHAWAAALTADSGRMEWNEPRDILHVHLPVPRMEQLIGHELRAYTHARLGATALRASVNSEQLLGRTAGASSALVDSIPRALHATVAYLAGLSRFPPQVEARSNRPNRLDRSTLPETYRAPAAAAAVRSRSLSSLTKPATALTATTAPDNYGLNQILAHNWLLTDTGELSMIVLVACTTPLTGGANWTIPVRSSTGFHCPYAFNPSSMLSYSSTTVVLSNADDTSAPAVTHVFSASDYPLKVLTSTGQAAMVLSIPLPSDFVGFNLQITYSWAGQLASFPYGAPFAVKGSPRIVPLLVSQLYGVADALAAGATDAARSRARMSIAALAINPVSQAYYDANDIGMFLDQNRIDPWTAHSHLAFVGAQGEGNNPGHADAETTLDISEAMGANAYVGLSALHVPDSSTTPFEDLMNLVLADPSIKVLSISYGTDEENVRDATGPSNALFMQLGSSGVSVFVSSGDSGAFLASTGCAAFAPAWPASSPWVTSVGGSTLSTRNAGSQQCQSEVVCSVETGSSITSGGGFSALSREQPQPAYQRAAVAGWLNSTSCAKPPSAMGYNVLNRAYPDVTLLAHNYAIAFQGELAQVDGTSASAPVLAGIIARYNLARASTGLPALGFLNPLLYSTAASTPEAFNDIVQGSSRCMGLREGCCSEGYESCVGFDPVSGLGSPNLRVLGPILYPDANANVSVSNYFFPACANYAAWPASPAWPDHSAPAANNHTGVVVGITLLMVALVALVIFAAMQAYHRRKYGVPAQARPAAGHAVPMQPMPMRGGDAAGQHNWGAGRPLGHAIVPVQPEGPLSPNDLSAPLAGPGPQSDE